MEPFRKILVATDFSPSADAAAELGASLARAMGGSLTLLHVYQLPNFVLPDGTTVLTSSSTLGDIISVVDQKLAALRDRLADGIPVETRAIEGDPAKGVVGAAREGDYDLVVVGTHGRTGLEHLLLGSIAEKIVRTSPVPVLTVRAG